MDNDDLWLLKEETWLKKGLTNPRHQVAMVPRNFIGMPAIFRSDFIVLILRGTSFISEYGFLYDMCINYMFFSLLVYMFTLHHSVLVDEFVS